MPQDQTRRRTGVEPLDDVKRHIQSPSEKRGLTLKELFVDGRGKDDQTLERLLDETTLKIIAAFRPDTVEGYPRARRPKMTDHYLPRLGGDVDDLIQALWKSHRKSVDFVQRGDLPHEYRVLTEYWCDRVRAQARYLLLRELIHRLAEKSALWYHPGSERWQAAQSLIDQYKPLRRKVMKLRKAKQHLKLDKRPWHGRPARDRQRDVRPGTSVGNGR